MRRPHLPGLDVGGAWTNPLRPAIEAWELAYILEVPECEVRELLGPTISVRAARDLLRRLAGENRLDGSEESWLFARLIAGHIHIDPTGYVWVAVSGQPSGRPIKRRRQDLSLHKGPPPIESWEDIERRRELS
jgi:hypothetical protein